MTENKWAILACNDRKMAYITLGKKSLVAPANKSGSVGQKMWIPQLLPTIIDILLVYHRNINGIIFFPCV